MTRAITLIQTYFVGSLRAITQDVSRRLFEQVRYGDVYLFVACLDLHSSDTSQIRLLYTRFTTVSGQVSPLLGELERRARVHPDELGSCYPSTMPRTSTHARTYLFRVLLSKSADLILQGLNSFYSYVFLLL